MGEGVGRARPRPRRAARRPQRAAGPPGLPAQPPPIPGHPPGARQRAGVHLLGRARPSTSRSPSASCRRSATCSGPVREALKAMRRTLEAAGAFPESLEVLARDRGAGDRRRPLRPGGRGMSGRPAFRLTRNGRPVAEVGLGPGESAVPRGERGDHRGRPALRLRGRRPRARRGVSGPGRRPGVGRGGEGGTGRDRRGRPGRIGRLGRRPLLRRRPRDGRGPAGVPQRAPAAAPGRSGPGCRSTSDRTSSPRTGTAR